jgi:hypothetical protein
MLVQNFQVQLIRPPVTVRRASAGGVMEGAFRFSCHCFLFCHFFPSISVTRVARTTC